MAAGEQYTDQISRLARAFVHGATLCRIECACGRVHFVSSPQRGDYGDGELESLQAQAAKEPDKYIEEPVFGSIDFFYEGGKPVVPDCKCGRAERIANWLDGNAENIVDYLTLYFIDKKKNAEAIVEKAGKSLEALAVLPHVELPVNTTRQFDFGRHP
jgi:hypothetical protein